MRTSSALSLAVLLLAFFNHLTFGQTASGSNCSLTATYNETLLAELAAHFDKDSSTVIIEYTISFNSDFDYSKRSAPDAFQPWKWYRTQGKYSSQLLLSYELYYGLLKNILYFNIKAATVHLDVSPAGCFHRLENDEIEALVLNFLLKDFRIDGNTVAHSFTYSDDVEICTARLGEGVTWGALIYKCCGYDPAHTMYCEDIAANDWMLALIIFIIATTSFAALYMPLIVPKPYFEEDFYYTPKDGNVLEFKIKVDDKTSCLKNCDCSKDDSSSLSVNRLKKMKEFYASAKKYLQLDENILKQSDVFKKDLKRDENILEQSDVLTKDQNLDENILKQSDVFKKDLKRDENILEQSDVLNKDLKLDENILEQSDVLNKDLKLDENILEQSDVLNKDLKLDENILEQSDVFNKDLKLDENILEQSDVFLKLDDNILEQSDVFNKDLKRDENILEQSDVFIKLDDNILEQSDVFNIRVKEVRFAISTSKLIWENKRTINVFGNILDFFIDHEQHQGDIECFCTKCTWYFRRILRFGFMVALALPSLPLAYAVCAEGTWHRQVADANKSIGHETYLYQLWRMSPKTGLGVTLFVYAVYFLHMFLYVFCEKFTQRLYKHISVSSDSKFKLNHFIQYVIKKMIVDDIADVRRVQNIKYLILWFANYVLFLILVAVSPLALLVTPCVLLSRHDIPCSNPKCNPCKMIFIFYFFFLFLISSPMAVFIFIIGINFFLHVAVMIITILVVQSSLLYEIIPIILLLMFYIWDSFNQVQNPFNAFMKTLVAINFFKGFHAHSHVIPNQENRVQSCVDDTHNDGKKRSLQVRNGAVHLTIKEPFIYSNEFKISKKFFLHCATVDYSGAPQSLGHNYKKAFARFLKIALFIVFVFLVMMAFGHITFISPSSRTFLTFFAGILPHILYKFSKSYNPFTKDMFRDERFMRKLYDRVESFQEKWKVKDIYIDDIKEVSETDDVDLKVLIPSSQEKCARFPANSDDSVESATNSAPSDVEEHGVWYRQRKTVPSQIAGNNNDQSEDPSTSTDENNCEKETDREQGISELPTTAIASSNLEMRAKDENGSSPVNDVIA